MMVKYKYTIVTLSAVHGSWRSPDVASVAPLQFLAAAINLLALRNSTGREGKEVEKEWQRRGRDW
jgi:hypothetical protein